MTSAAAPLLLSAGAPAIDRYLLPAGPSAANPPLAAAAVCLWDRQQHLSVDGTDRWTDGRTLERFINPTPHTIRAAVFPVVTVTKRQLFIDAFSTFEHRDIDLCIPPGRVSDRCAVARCVSRRRGNTGRQRQVVP